MSDIEHWLDGDVPDEIGEYLRAARAEAPRSELVERCAVAVAAGGIALAAAASKSSFGVGSGLLGSSSGAGAVTGLALVKWGAGGVLAGTLFATGIGLAVRIDDGARRIESASERGVHLPAPLPSGGAPVPKAPLPAPLTAPAATAVNSSATTRSKAVASASTPDTRLTEELSLLGRARASIDARNTTLAGELLAEHERRFGQSARLSPEARYLRLELLADTGRREEARALAREILKRDSSGPHVARARAVLEEK